MLFRSIDAKAFLNSYNSWANGEGYGYRVEEVITLPCGHTETNELDSCFGFYASDLDYMAECVRAAVGDDTVEISGEAKDIAAYHDFGKGA